MDIRTKLVFALVAVSLASMLALGLAVSPRVEGYLRDGRLRQLDELAEAKRQALHFIIEGWRDRTDLVASRAQLRASLDEYRDAGGVEPAARAESILTDAITASHSAAFLAVYDVQGQFVASAARDPERSFPPEELTLAPPPEGETTYAGVEFAGSGAPRVAFTTRMAWEGRAVGTLVAIFEARELLELTGYYDGLGETGETLVFARDATGVLRTLHPTRHGAGRRMGVVLSEAPGTDAALALAGETEPVWRGITDYRGQDVWAATRSVPEAGWGLVAKVDRDEEVGPYEAFSAWLRRTALILAAFAILAGFGLGLRFALPIHELAAVANRIRGGEMGARAHVEQQDEVGQLARTFNEMADELEEQMSLLHEFRRFFDVSIDLMCIAGTDGYFKRVNPAFVRQLGWSEEELLERPFLDLVHPEDVAKTEQEVVKLARGIPTISFENRFLCKDGSHKLLRWTSYPEDGVLYAVAHVIEHASAT